jgi:hypothetical protein
MKKLALVILMMLPVFCWSQSTSRQSVEVIVPTNWERLHQDYEVKLVSNPNPDLIAQINLAQYENIREENVDIEVNDNVSGYTLIIYSKNKTFLHSSQNGNHLIPQSPNQH